VNDQPWRADLLGTLLAGKLAHVNLIPLNPTPGSRWDASPKPVQREFVRRLRAAGVATTVRDTRGREIDGACGQLAATETVAGDTPNGQDFAQDRVGFPRKLVQAGWAGSRGPEGKAKQ
jgi:23S rRNA (adenine2503-C2)-methyltransferase